MLVLILGALSIVFAVKEMWAAMGIVLIAILFILVLSEMAD